MAAPTLPVLSPDFSTVQLLHSLHAHVEIAFAKLELRQCWYEDGDCDCKELATVHLLGSDYEFCDRHFELLTRGFSPEGIRNRLACLEILGMESRR